MPLSVSEAQKLRSVVAPFQSKNQKLQKIATYEARVSLPVVLFLLEEIQKILNTTKNETLELKATKEFIAYGIVILRETDIKQNASLLKLPGILKSLSKEHIETELQKFVGYAGQIEVTAQTKALWEEASLWLEGLYTRVDIKVPKEKDGSPKKNKNGLVDPVDAEDKLFNTFVHLTKYAIVSYYRQVAIAINEKCAIYMKKELAESKPIMEKAVNSEALVKTNVPVGKIENALSETAAPALVFLQRTGQHTRLVFDYNENQEEKMQALLTAYKQIMGVSALELIDQPFLEHELIETEQATAEEKVELPLELLEKYSSENPDIKFSILICALDQYKLNDNQTHFLQTFKGMIESSLKAYTKSAFTTWGFPTYLISRPHVPEVETKMNEIASTPDPIQHLKLLFDLLINMRGENSNNVKKKVSFLLENAYTILLKNAKPELHQAHRSH